MAKKILFYILLFAIGIKAFAQDNLTISGKLTDKENGDPLIFASIGIKGKPIGTISNSLGEFDFHFPAAYRNDVMVVSMMGYENYEAPIRYLLNKDTVVIPLNKAVKVLDEVVISDTLTGGEIVNIAINRIANNYPMKPFIMDGFYRDVKKIGGTYVSLLEAAVKIYDENYKEPRNKYRLRERVSLMEVRKSLGYNHKFSRFFDQDNLLEDMLLHNSIRYRQFAMEETFLSKLKRLKDTYYDDHKVFVVELVNGNYLKMYIDIDTYAFVRVETEMDFRDEIVNKKKKLVGKFDGLKKIIDFKKFDEKMYLNYMHVVSNINWYDRESEELRFETELTQELLINRIYPDTENRIGRTEKMKRYGLQYQDEEYNKEFWSSYNVIKETPIDESILEDLERDVTLEEQFEEY